MFPDRVARRLDETEVQRIAVIKPTAFGDVVQSLPILGALAERFPAARVSWVISEPLSELVAGHPLLDEWIPYRRRGGWRQWRKLLATLRSRRFDLVFDLQGLLRTAVMTRATAAPLRIGLETAREGSGLACHGLLEDTGRQVPAHRRYWRVAEFLGVGGLTPRAGLENSRSEHAWADAMIRQLGGRVVAIHPGARWETKRWPIEHFAAVGVHAIREHDASLVLVGSPDERMAAARLKELILRQATGGRVENLAGQTGLKKLAAVLAAVDVVVTNDSGPMHLAAAMETPVIGVFTCTTARRSGPPGGRHVLIETSVTCGGSYHKRCPHRGDRHLACLQDVSAAEACEGLDRLLGVVPAIVRPKVA